MIGTFFTLAVAAAATIGASDSTKYVVPNHGRGAGDMVVVTAGDSTVARWIFMDRNRGMRMETRYRFGADKRLRSADVRQIAPNGQALEPNGAFEIRGDTVRWMLSGGRGGGSGAPPAEKVDPTAFLGIRTSAPYEQALLASFLLKQPKVTAKIQPGGTAHAEIAGEAMVQTRSGRAHVRLVMVYSGTSTTPTGVWLDKKNTLFVTEAEWFITLRPGAEAALPALRAIEVKYRNAQGEAIAKKVTAPRVETVVIKNGDLFDSESSTMRPNMSVVIRDDRIVEVGAAAAVATPAADEGPGRGAGPTEVIATTVDEALAYIARYDSAGYKQIKLYNIVQQDLVPAIAAETHKRGMRLSGHVPRGLSVRVAVQLGYDEIQHAAFLFSTFYQDSLYLPVMRAYSAVATAVAPNIDVDDAPMTDLIKFLHDHNTVIDGTFNLWIGGGASLVGAGGSTNQQKTDAAYLRLIKRLYDGGVTLVAGTDNSFGNTYHREIELYEQAGIPAPQVLQIATIGSARVMKEEEKDYGSITTGKVADTIMVSGKPAQQVKDVEKVETVIRGGRIYAVKELMSAVSGQK